MLEKPPFIKQRSVRYSTSLFAIPSAPVERLVSSASLVLMKRRNRLDDRLFETRAILSHSALLEIDELITTDTVHIIL